MAPKAKLILQASRSSKWWLESRDIFGNLKPDQYEYAAYNKWLAMASLLPIHFLDLTPVARLEAHFERLEDKRQTSWEVRAVDCIEDWATPRILGQDNLKGHDEPNQKDAEFPVSRLVPGVHA